MVEEKEYASYDKMLEQLGYKKEERKLIIAFLETLAAILVADYVKTHGIYEHDV